MKTLRIVLSFLCLSILACSGYEAAHDDEPNSTDGIGTSPSEPTTGVESALTAPQPCGIWYSHDGVESAEQVSLQRGPDVVVYTQPGGLACSWAFQLSALVWPGKSFIRYVP